MRWLKRELLVIAGQVPAMLLAGGFILGIGTWWAVIAAFPLAMLMAYFEGLAFAAGEERGKRKGEPCTEK